MYKRQGGYVNDWAGVFAPEQKDALERRLAEAKQASGAELAVVTLPSLQGGEINDFTHKLFQQWGIGEKGKDNGILLLMALEERRVRIEPGYGFEETLTEDVYKRQVQAEQMLREAAAGLNVGFRSLQSDLRRIQRQKYRPTPATEPSAPPPPAVERPADELELAQLLGTHSDPELTGLVRQWLRYDLITDADCRAVIRAIAEEETDLMAALDEESDVCKTFAAQVVNAPQKIVGEEPEADVLKACLLYTSACCREALCYRKALFYIKKSQRLLLSRKQRLKHQ